MNNTQTEAKDDIKVGTGTGEGTRKREINIFQENQKGNKGQEKFLEGKV